MTPAPIPGLTALAAAAGALKRVRRKGWVDRGILHGESVADHSYRLALLAWMVGLARGLDADRAIRLALVHDLGESQVGDETPFDAALQAADFDPTAFDRPAPLDGDRRAARHAREAAAIAALAAELPDPLGTVLEAAWLEYAEGVSPEARLVKELDRVETLLQAEEYRADRPTLPIGSFRHDVESRGLAGDLRPLVDPRRES